MFLYQGGLAICTRSASGRASKTQRRRLSKGIFAPPSSRKHQWFLLWFDLITKNPQECGECWQSVYDGQKPASQAGHQGRPDWTLLVKHQKLRSRSRSTSLYEGFVETHVQDDFKCWINRPSIMFLILQLDQYAWTHSYSKNWCYGHVLLLMICCRLLSTIKLLWIWSKKCQNKCYAVFFNHIDKMYHNYMLKD